MEIVFVDRIDSNLKLWFKSFDSIRNFYDKIYGSTHFYANIKRGRRMISSSSSLPSSYIIYSSNFKPSML